MTEPHTAPAHEPDQRSDRRILVTLLAAIFVALLGVGIVVPIMPLYAEGLGASSTMLGLMVAGFSISRGVLQPIVGGMSDRRGRRRFMLAGLAIYALAGPLYVVAGSVVDLILIRIFQGVGSAMIVPIAMSYVGDLAPDGQEGRVMSKFNIALFSGIGAGPIIGGVFLDNLGTASAFYAMSALAGASLLLVQFVLPPDSGRAVVDERRLLPTFLAMMHNPRVIGIMGARLSTMIVMVPSMAFLPLLMSDFMDATGAQIGMVIATRTLVNAGLQTPFGRLVDKYDRGRLLLIGSCIMAAAMLTIPLAGGFVHLLGLFALIGIGEAVVWPTLGALATEEGRFYGQGSVMGLFNMSMSVGILIGSLGAGTMADRFGIASAFTTVGIVLLVVAVIATRLIHTDVDRALLTGGLEQPTTGRVAGPTLEESVPVSRASTSTSAP